MRHQSVLVLKLMLERVLTWHCFRLEVVSETWLILGRRASASFEEREDNDKLTSYGSFFRVPKDGMDPSFCVSAQWKIS
jgi:hypothetical protein